MRIAIDTVRRGLVIIMRKPVLNGGIEDGEDDNEEDNAE